MRGVFVFGIVLLTICISQKVSAADAMKMVKIGGGIYRPFYPPSPNEKEIPVKAFWLQSRPVTNGEFLAFVRRHPEWRRDQIKRLFADERYLIHWRGGLDLDSREAVDQPVTNVSWFAAEAYCESRLARLPTEAEWEYVAQASETAPDARADLGWRNRVLEWYSRPTPRLFPKVGQGTPNYFGVYDLHGLVWEWVFDFNSALISGDNRENAESPEKNRFCGAGAQVATEKDDYASFMRIAFRSSLKAAYTAGTLGFRCARDLSQGVAP